jgi:hypothetical protein
MWVDRARITVHLEVMGDDASLIAKGGRLSRFVNVFGKTAL